MLTFFYVNLQKNTVTEDGLYEFTDGCGRMSTAIAQKFVEKMNAEKRYAHQKYKIPSVLQIRMMGCKGILVHDPSLDDPTKNPEGIQVYLRNSQKKFPWNLATIKKGKCYYDMLY